MARFTLALALWLFTSTAHAQLTRDAVGNGRSALEAQLTSGARAEDPHAASYYGAILLRKPGNVSS